MFWGNCSQESLSDKCYSFLNQLSSFTQEKEIRKLLDSFSWHQWHRSKREYTDLFDDANDVDDVNDAPLGKLHTYRQDMALKLMPESLPFGI